MHKILITGSSGFIGTNLMLYFLRNTKYEVLNIDNKESPIYDIQKVTEKIDITDLTALQESITRFAPDYIVHLAARTDLDGVSLEDYSANIVGVENLMKVVKTLTNLKKVLIASSMLVCHTGYYPRNQVDYSPTTLYGQSKVETEKIVWRNRPYCDWAIIRPTSIWGPWFGIPYKNFFDMIIANQYFHIGNKGCTKTYGYVGNAVYQIEQILFNETLDENRKIFYIGDSPATNIEEWGNEIAEELGHKILKVPYGLMKVAALLGDVFKFAGLKFPLSSFRLKNMTTDNIIDLINTYNIAPNPPYTRIEGVRNTLDWINRNK